MEIELIDDILVSDVGVDVFEETSKNWKVLVTLYFESFGKTGLRDVEVSLSTQSRRRIISQQFSLTIETENGKSNSSVFLKVPKVVDAIKCFLVIVTHRT